METNKYFTMGVVGVVVLAVIGIWAFVFKDQSMGTTPVPDIVIPMAVATSTYASSTLGVSVVYPKTYAVNEAYAYDQFGPKKLIHGVKFLMPESMATGTNLSAVDTGVSVEQLPRAVRCTGDIYLLANVKAQSTIINGVNYSVATSSGAAAGNLYEEIIYALADSKPCTALRYFMHSSNIDNYATNTPIREFDRAAVLKDFDAIRDSLQLTR
jgi:hypothetical protein